MIGLACAGIVAIAFVAIAELVRGRKAADTRPSPTARAVPHEGQARDSSRPAAGGAYGLSLERAGATAVLLTPQGAPLLRVPPALVVDHGAGPLTLTSTWSWRDERTLLAKLEGDAVEVALGVTLVEGRPFLDLSVELTYLRRVEVTSETWSLVPEAASGEVLDRAYRWGVVDGVELGDRFTPHVGRWHSRRDDGEFNLVGFDDLQAVVASNDRILLELDQAKNHPHLAYTKCWATYSGQHAEDDRSRNVRLPGSAERHSVRLVVGPASFPTLARFPPGKTAAFVITDHADRSSVAGLEALLYGASPRGDGAAGVLGHHLRLTKTVFADAMNQVQLADAEFLRLARSAAAAGIEIAPHSPTARADTADDVARALPYFTEFAPATWVDHQPDTNCEAINNRGALPEGPFGLAKPLTPTAIRLFWAFPEVDPTPSLNLLNPSRPGNRATVLYPFPQGAAVPPDSYLFRSMWMFVSVSELRKRWSEDSLNQLETEHGIHIAHTYLDGLPSGPLGKNSLFEQDAGGALVTRAQVRELWARLEAHQARGLWVTTMRDLGAWLRQWARVRVNVLDAQTFSLAGAAATHTALFHVGSAHQLTVDAPADQRMTAPARMFDPAASIVKRD